MKYVNDLKGDDNEWRMGFDESQQGMYMNEYEEAYDLSCYVITNFSDFGVLDEYIGMMAAV